MIDRPQHTPKIFRISEPLSPKAKPAPVIIIAMTPAIFDTGPVIDCRILSRGPSQGMPDPDAHAQTGTRNRAMSKTKIKILKR